MPNRICLEGVDIGMSVRNWARNIIYRLLYALSGPGQSIRVILFYHSVGSDAPNSIPLSVFKRQMEVLTERFKVVRLCDLPEAMASSSSNANIACVTFDDGRSDNYDCALPVLERFGVKVTFFIATGFLGKTFPTFAGEYLMMTSAQVRELAALGHEIGAHTTSHPKLTKVPIETARAEVEDSKRFLEDLLGSEIVSFAYPKGDCNEAVKTLVGSLGFWMAVTIREGLVSESPDWLALPRVWISGSLSIAAFEAKMSPATRWYGRLRKLD